MPFVLPRAGLTAVFHSRPAVNTRFFAGRLPSATFSSQKSLDTSGLNEQIVYALSWTIWQRGKKYAILCAQGPVLA